jgi:hypothetical protein
MRDTFASTRPPPAADVFELARQGHLGTNDREGTDADHAPHAGITSRPTPKARRKSQYEAGADDGSDLFGADRAHAASA